MEEVTPQPDQESTPSQEASSQETAPARAPRQAAPPPIGLDDRGEALKALLPGPLAPFEPEVDTALDEVVVTVASARLLDACATLRGDPSLSFDYLRCLSVVDYEDRFQVVYHLWSREHRHKLTLKVDTSPETPSVPSVTGVWRGADWFEREGHDLFGVEFPGHPDPRVLILYEEFEGFPGRKSFPFHDYQEW
ncbi:MAG: NADH-quinone oxidoreductase subunit C [Chloroflexi bacterium]|nr:NADH-quinone oxidoreductase subunit C [Chloroflexota bacterium]